MARLIDSLGVQSYCFRGFKDNARVAELVRECGLSAIELCGVHVDFNAPDQWDAAITPYRDAGIEIVSIGVQTFTGDVARERQWFEFAAKAGAKFISAHFKPDSWQDAVPKTEALADEFDFKIAIHNHGGHHWLGNSQMLSHVLSVAGPRIGLCLDTAWCLDAHEDPLKWTERFGDRLYGLHLKDFTFDRARTPKDVVVGTGNLDLPGLIAKLPGIHYAGYTVLEYEGDVNDPVPALKQCVEQVRSAA